MGDYREGTLADIHEKQRLKTLSHEDLVREHGELQTDDDDELYVEEMWTRLWPEWEENL